MQVRKLVAVCLLVALLSVFALGKTAPKPSGDVALTVSGTIALTNNNGVFEFDMGMLKALPSTEYGALDPWSGQQVYTGVSIKTLLEYLGYPKDATAVKFIAEDDEVSEIPIGDILAYPIMLAYQTQGFDLPHRMGGPLKLMWPWNEDYPTMAKLYPPKAQKNYWILKMEVEY